jgi:hypothetical protein
MAKKRKAQEDVKMSAQDAMDLCDDMDLPDGAYWAMVEEMSGCTPDECVDDDDMYDSDIKEHGTHYTTDGKA